MGSVLRRSPGIGRLCLVGALCAALPDIDVIGFGFGIDHGALLGHRGFTHSLPFAAVVASIVTPIAFRDRGGAGWFYLFVATASHGFLDALTDGGLGVAFFSPFSNARYSFPVRPIRVSPLRIDALLSHRGLAVVWSEARWVWLPCAFFVAIVLASQRHRATRPRPGPL